MLVAVGFNGPVEELGNGDAHTRGGALYPREYLPGKGHAAEFPSIGILKDTDDAADGPRQGGSRRVQCADCSGSFGLRRGRATATVSYET